MPLSQWPGAESRVECFVRNRSRHCTKTLSNFPQTFSPFHPNIVDRSTTRWKCPFICSTGTFSFSHGPPNDVAALVSSPIARVAPVVLVLVARSRGAVFSEKYWALGKQL
jgi:hypothetical protein